MKNDVSEMIAPDTVREIALAKGESCGDQIEVSVVMPCLNEADALADCIRRAAGSLADHQIIGEVIVADNGSDDGSPELAHKFGARLVAVPERGYGRALMAGISAARGRYIIMADADGSYDLGEVHRFVEKLREGFELVQGCRLPSGGGKIAAGAMPLMHRWIGNPFFSWIARWWFASDIHDIYCGMRGFTRELFVRLDQRCTGMEFATEMIIKSTLHGARITELPITLHRDGRKSHGPHLRTFRDGWRTLRFLLLYCPRWLFLVPGLLLIIAGLAGYAIALPGMTFGQVTFDVHTLLFASLAILCGYQAILFAILAKTFAVTEGLLPEDPRLWRLFEVLNLERGLLIGAGAIVMGLVLLFLAINDWRLNDFGRLDYSHTMRWVIPGATLTSAGVQTLFSSFMVSLLGMHRR
jgi:glycosyltransferase involved in cell wall biosynthesis